MVPLVDQRCALGDPLHDLPREVFGEDGVGVDKVVRVIQDFFHGFYEGEDFFIDFNVLLYHLEKVGSN